MKTNTGRKSSEAKGRAIASSRKRIQRRLSATHRTTPMKQRSNQFVSIGRNPTCAFASTGGCRLSSCCHQPGSAAGL